eukprot:PLAT2461.1.p1 GENE.PLAT2461.1~~PLAT2461.1.p1  ORF type:complete len:2014 (-),score=847.26 PLAT2461.1:55-5613(-)
MFRLTSLQRVRALSLRISAPQKRFVRRVSLFFALQPAMEVVDVGSGKWQRFHTVRLPSASAGFTCELSVPFTASHIMIRYDDFHGGPLEAVRCPRCAQVVDARLAICGACGEAVLQCQQCRHINYDVLGAFLCCECGHSRYGQFSLRLTVTPSWQLGSVASDVDFDEGLSMLSNLSSAASCTWADVRRMRGRLHRDILQLPESDSEEDDDDADGSDADTTAALADSSDDSGIDWPPSAASAAGRVSRPSAARIRAAELSPFSSMLPSLTESEAMDDFPLLVGFGDDAAARREQQRARRRDLRRFRRQLSEGRPASRPPSTHSASSASDFPAWRMAWQSDAARPPSSASSSSSPSPWLSLLTSELGGSPSGESSPSGDYSPLLHREWPSGGGGDSMTASVSLRSRAGDRRSSRAALPLRDRDRDRDHDYPPLGRQSSLSSNSSSVSSPVAAFTAAHRSRQRSEEKSGSAGSRAAEEEKQPGGEEVDEQPSRLAWLTQVKRDYSTSMQRAFNALARSAYGMRSISSQLHKREPMAPPPGLQPSCFGCQQAFADCMVSLLSHASESAAIPTDSGHSDLLPLAACRALLLLLRRGERVDAVLPLLARQWSSQPKLFACHLLPDVCQHAAAVMQALSSGLLPAEPVKLRGELRLLCQAAVMDAPGVSDAACRLLCRLAAWQPLSPVQADGLLLPVVKAVTSAPSHFARVATAMLANWQVAGWRGRWLTVDQQQPRMSAATAAARWRAAARRRAATQVSALWSLLITPASARVRYCMTVACSQQLRGSLRLRVVDAMTALWEVCLTSRRRMDVAELHIAYESLLSSATVCRFLLCRGAMRYFADLVAEEALLLEQSSATTVDVRAGRTLQAMVGILGQLWMQASQGGDVKQRHVTALLRAFLGTQHVVIHRSSASEAARMYMESIVRSVLEASSGRRALLRGCVELMESLVPPDGEDVVDEWGIELLLTEMLSLLSDDGQVDDFFIMLSRTPTQEDFFRGSLPTNPLPLSALEEEQPLVSHLRARVAADLGIADSEEILELLVGGNILGLALPLKLVHKQLWLRLESDDIDEHVLEVTYRLAGLDGEATEPLVEELKEDEEERDVEAELGVTRELGRAGFRLLLSLLPRVSEDVVHSVLHLLARCAQLPDNCTLLVELQCHEQLLPIASVAQQWTPSCQAVLDILSTLATHSQLAPAEGMAAQQAAQVAEAISKMIAAACAAGVPSPAVATQLASVLHMYCRRSAAVVEATVAGFAASLALRAFDRSNTVSWRGKLTVIASFLSSLPAGAQGHAVRDAMLQQGLTAAVCDYVVACTPATARGRQPRRKRRRVERKSSEDDSGGRAEAAASAWADALALPGLSHALTVLWHCAKQHAASQRVLLDLGVVRKAHVLESSVDVGNLGVLSENVMEALLEEDSVAREEATRLRSVTKQRKRKRAMAKRKRALQKLGMTMKPSQAAGGMVVKKAADAALLREMESVEDELGLRCLVCHDGFQSAPDSPLALYVLAHTAVDRRRGTTLTVATAMQAIHPRCHKHATAADKHLKSPRSEWAGATARNQRVQCNNLMPVRGGTVAEEALAGLADEFFTRLPDRVRAGTAAVDLAQSALFSLVRQLSQQALVAAGGTSSNVKLLPYIARFVQQLMDEAQLATARARVRCFLPTDGSKRAEARLLADAGDASTLAAIVCSPEAWLSMLPHLLRWLLRAACMPDSADRRAPAPRHMRMEWSLSTDGAEEEAEQSSPLAAMDIEDESEEKKEADVMHERQQSFEHCQPALLQAVLLCGLAQALREESDVQLFKAAEALAQAYDCARKASTVRELFALMAVLSEALPAEAASASAKEDDAACLSALMIAKE